MRQAVTSLTSVSHKEGKRFMMSRSISAMAALGALILVGLLLAGCGDGGANSVANVRVFNGLIGSAGAGGVNVTLRNPGTVPVNATPVLFGQVSTTRRAGSGDGQNTYLFLANSATQQSIQKFDYPQDNTGANSTSELLVATGIVGQSSPAPQLIYVRSSVPISLVRNSSGQPTANALLRVINAAPGTNNGISIFNEAGTTPAAITDLSNIAFGRYSSGGNTSSNYATLIGATYSLSIRDAQNGAVLMALPTVSLQPGFAYTLVVYGSPTAALAAPVLGGLVQDYPIP